MGKIGDQLRDRKLPDGGLLRLLKQAEEELIRQIARSSEPFRAARAQQVRAIDAVIFELQTGLKDWTDDMIPRLFAAGADEAAATIHTFGEAEFDMQFSGVSKNAIQILADDAFLEFGKTLATLKGNARLALNHKIKMQEGIIKAVMQGQNIYRTQQQLIDGLRENGITGFRGRNGFGRNIKIEFYANMLVRTQTMTAYNLGTRNQMLGMGRRFAIFPTIRPDIDGEDVCNEWERKKYLDLKKDPLPPQSTHPACRHAPQPVSFAQLQRERPDLYKIAVADFRRRAGH